MKILGICGSLRKASWNRKLLTRALEAIDETGAETAVFDLNPVPMYHPDREASDGIPPEAEAMRRAILEADAIVVACPEYNSSMTAALKNAFEWASRRGNVLSGKIFFVIGTGPRPLRLRPDAYARHLQLGVRRRHSHPPAPRPPSHRNQLHDRRRNHHRPNRNRLAKPSRPSPNNLRPAPSVGSLTPHLRASSAHVL